MHLPERRYASRGCARHDGRVVDVHRGDDLRNAAALGAGEDFLGQPDGEDQAAGAQDEREPGVRGRHVVEPGRGPVGGLGERDGGEADDDGAAPDRDAAAP